MSTNSAARKRGDPRMRLATYLEHVVETMSHADKTGVFALPVDARKVPDYYQIITEPMDLQTLRKRAASLEFFNRQQFWEAAHRIYTNSIRYNGAASPITLQANDVVKAGLAELEVRQYPLG